MHKSPSKLVRAAARGQITLPIEFRRRLKIDSNSILQVTLKDGRLEIVPLRPVPQEEAGRDYSTDEIERFLAQDRIDAGVARRVRRLLGQKNSA